MSGGGFPTALLLYSGDDDGYGSGETPRCMVELYIIGINGEIRNKPGWWTKVHDEEIVRKWRQEIVAGVSENRRERRERAFDYSLEESRWLAGQFLSHARPTAVDGVFAVEELPATLKEDLVRGVALLRSRPAIGSDREDRHPGTPQMVDLVHPSLYCYEHGKTAVLKDGRTDSPTTSFSSIGESHDAMLPSRRLMSKDHVGDSLKGLQWLPAQVKVVTGDGEGICASFESYINSLHPKQYPHLYQNLERLLVEVIPLWEEVLSELGRWDPEKPAAAPRHRPLRVPVDSYGWWADYREQGDDEDDDDYWEFVTEFQNNEENFVHPTIPDFEPPVYSEPKANVVLRSGQRDLQVIVKIASLELQPEESFPGGSWHVEGTTEESIVATACCYLECENVDGGDLCFRTAVCEPDYEQDDRTGVQLMYGLEDQGSLIQDRGRCSPRTGKILAWPNTLQHRVDPIRLVDPSRPGKRTIICFFLVDPTLTVTSTASVPPQQHEWIAQEISALLFRKLPDSLRRHVASYVPGMRYEEACERRLALMDERRAQVREDGTSRTFMERPFSLCEH